MPYYHGILVWIFCIFNVRVDIVTGSINTVTGSIDTVMSRVDTVMDSVDTVTGRVDTVMSSVDTVMSSVDTVMGDVDTVTGRVDTVMSSVDTVMSSVDTVMGSVDTVEGSVDTVMGDVDTVMGDVDTVVGDVDTVMGSVDTVTGSVDIVMGDVDTVMGDVDTVMGDVDTVMNRCKVAYNTTTSKCCSENTITMLCVILKSLKWNKAVIFYETNRGGGFLIIALNRCFVGEDGFFFTQFNVFNQTRDEMRKILTAMYKQATVNGVQAILIVGDKALQLLTEAENLDEQSNKTTNYRTNSQWILVGDGDQSGKPNSGLKLKNVIMLECYGHCFKIKSLPTDSHLDLSCLGRRSPSSISSELMSGYCYGRVSTLPADSPDDLPCMGNNSRFSVLNFHKCPQGTFFPNSGYKLNDRHLYIGTIESTSFFEVHTDINNNTVYKGMVVELTKVLAQALNFSFTFVQPVDHSWGVKVNGEWNGLVRDLIDEKVDLVVADLTVTGERLEVIDFIFPAFLSQNLGILYKKGIASESSWIRVFKPLHADVYGCTCAVLVFIGILLLVFDRTDFNEMSRLQNLVSIEYLSGLFLSLIGAISLRGNGLQPRTSSAKILVTCFWMFCVVITGTYIGNLTAKLSETKDKKPFNSFEELVKLPDWTWGIDDELTEQLIRTHDSEAMKKLWSGLVAFNKTDPRVLLFNYNYHFDRILEADNKYAYILFDAKYYAYNRMDCAFELAESVMSALSLAIAVRKNCYLIPELENVMWTIFNNGVLQKLDEIHYRDRRPSTCMVHQHLKAVQLNDMQGLVLVVGIGILLALIVLMLEFIHIRRCARTE